MAESLDSIGDLARHTRLRSRVRAAMFVAARDVGAEGSALDDDEYQERRRRLAQEIARDADDWVDGFSWLVAANPVIHEGSSDGDIQFTVNSVWNAVAAAGATPEVAS